MKSIVASLIICMGFSHLLAQDVVPSTLYTGSSVVPHDKPYYKYEDQKNNVEIIYTKDNLPFAKHAADIETPLNKDYKKFFNWELDETLYVGLISDYNQIANGFSTQWPNNRQINYVGGTQLVDYFTTTSWLNTLLYHETAHNYQVNVKGSVVSRSLHSVFGNGTFIVPFPLAVPNVMENSFMLEGNAVLNESWHGNGGRLYSGRLKAQTLLQAKADKIKANYVYNSKLAFPYGEIVYIQGGFFNLYIAEKHGIESVNSYFRYKSEDWWWPFRTNWSMQDALGLNFEKSLNEFAKKYSLMAQELVEVEGERIASSQFFSSLSNSEDEIFFITNESGVRAPELIVLNKKTQHVTKKRDSWLSAKVIKKDGEYFTQGSRHTSPIKIYQGLFDNNAFIKEGSESKMIQGYLSDGKAVYFDVPSSYREPQLYVDGKFYAQVNSSVIIDKADNLYYFKQDAKTRTLYKNLTPLTSLEGFYSIVSDVDSAGRVYFVANSELGSTLYSFKDGVVSRASKADNIVEARLINDEELLIAAISDKDYYYVKSGVENIKQTPYETKLFFESKEYYANATKSLKESKSELDLDNSYYSALDMHYSGTNFSIGSSDGGVVGALNVNFGDPLSQNSASAFISRDDSNVTIAGVGYSNSQYLLQYTLRAYGVVDDYGRDDVRDSGVILSATLPFYQSGYYYGALGASYFQDYDTLEREPLSATFTFGRGENFGVSMFSNYTNMIQLYGVKEREDTISGAKYVFKHDLPSEFYIGLNAKYSQTNSLTGLDARGVKVTSSFDLDMDPSTINMPSLNGSAYVKDATYGEINLAKVINLSAYFFTFPLSLQREAVYAKYRYYELTDFGDYKHEANEVTAGLTLSTVFFNSFALPLSFEYIYNDADFIADESNFRFLLGASF